MVLVGAVATVLVMTVLFSVANKYWGVTLTTDGLAIPKPLGQPPQVERGVGTFEFVMTQEKDRSRPVSYDPCRVIEYELNDQLAPPYTTELVHKAVATVSRATGLQFRYLGTTDRSPGYDDRPFRAAREPVLIAWTTPAVVPELEGRTAGLGGSTPRRHDLSGDLEYVTGTVALDSPALHDVLGRPGGAAQVRAIVMHELAHLVGLDHVDDTNELMHRANAGRLDFGPGDREGLAELGSGRCYH
jgi:hypothetical protein